MATFSFAGNTNRLQREQIRISKLNAAISLYGLMNRIGDKAQMDVQQLRARAANAGSPEELAGVVNDIELFKRMTPDQYVPEDFKDGTFGSVVEGSAFSGTPSPTVEGSTSASPSFRAPSPTDEPQAPATAQPTRFGNVDFSGARGSYKYGFGSSAEMAKVQREAQLRQWEANSTTFGIAAIQGVAKDLGLERETDIYENPLYFEQARRNFYTAGARAGVKNEDLDGQWNEFKEAQEAWLEYGDDRMARQTEAADFFHKRILALFGRQEGVLDPRAMEGSDRKLYTLLEIAAADMAGQHALDPNFNLPLAWGVLLKRLTKQGYLEVAEPTNAPGKDEERWSGEPEWFRNLFRSYAAFGRPIEYDAGMDGVLIADDDGTPIFLSRTAAENTLANMEKLAVKMQEEQEKLMKEEMEKAVRETEEATKEAVKMYNTGRPSPEWLPEQPPRGLVQPGAEASYFGRLYGGRSR
jgi:hypothetical protein